MQNFYSGTIFSAHYVVLCKIDCAIFNCENVDTFTYRHFKQYIVIIIETINFSIFLIFFENCKFKAINYMNLIYWYLVQLNIAHLKKKFATYSNVFAKIYTNDCTSYYA